MTVFETQYKNMILKCGDAEQLLVEYLLWDTLKHTPARKHLAEVYGRSTCGQFLLVEKVRVLGNGASDVYGYMKHTKKNIPDCFLAEDVHDANYGVRNGAIIALDMGSIYDTDVVLEYNRSVNRYNKRKEAMYEHFVNT